MDQLDEKIINEVFIEKSRQDTNWGDRKYSAAQWASSLGEDFGEMCKAINNYEFNKTKENKKYIQEETVRMIASCFSMLESINSKRDKK